MNFYPESFEQERLDFIEQCLKWDIPRLEAETYSPEVKCISDIPYDDGKFGYDIYLPSGMNEGEMFEDAFLMVHGGAFVYGVKENNKLFGTTLSLKSGIPVINMDYPLLPEYTLVDVFEKMLYVADEIATKYGVKRIHVTGDSAGGYLSFVGAMIMAFDKMREDLKLTKKCDYTVGSASPICGCYRTPREAFPSHFYERGGVYELPSYMYDIGEAVKLFGAPKTFIITGEEDFLRSDNEYLKEVFDNLHLPYTYYIGMNCEDRKMEHIFPIPHPDWPESEVVIGMIIDNAKN